MQIFIFRIEFFIWMNKILAYLVISIFLINPVLALSITEMKSQIESASSDMSSFFDSIPKEDMIIIKGSKLSTEEKMVFNLIKSNMDKLQGIEIVPDTMQIDGSKYPVFLGSQKTNYALKNLEGKFIEEQNSLYSPIIIRKGLFNGKRSMILSSEREINNNENHAIKKSPLNLVMNEKYVPIVATLISMFLLYLWQVIGKTVMETINEFISSKLIDKKAKKKRQRKIKKNEFVNLNEIIAFIITVLVFSFIMSWTWTSDSNGFKKICMINLIVVFVITFIREIARLIFCYKFKLISELIFWRFGTVLTIISTLLGNTFSLASYTLLNEGTKDLKKYGKISFMISMFTFVVAIVTYVINLFSPSLILQMLFVYSIMTLFIEMFPKEPFTGYDIRLWSNTVWFISYVVIIIAYVSMNFTLYV